VPLCDSELTVDDDVRTSSRAVVSEPNVVRDFRFDDGGAVRRGVGGSLGSVEMIVAEMSGAGVVDDVRRLLAGLIVVEEGTAALADRAGLIGAV
jgi:hypothetical protein